MNQTYGNRNGNGYYGNNGQSDQNGQQENRSTTSININEPQRVTSLVAGGILAFAGLATLIVQKRLTGLALAAAGGELLRMGITGNSVVLQALGVNAATTGLSNQVSVPHQQGIKIEESVVINRPVEALFYVWRNFENLPYFMDHLKTVKVMDNNRSHWIAKAPIGLQVEWDAEIINEERNALIGWRSLEGSQINNAGSVRFKPSDDGRSTEVTVTLKYDPPGGAIGAAFAKLFGEEPQIQIKDDLRRFKWMMEVGDVPGNASF